MAKVKQITVKIGITKNLGNYESLRLDYEAVADLGPKDIAGEQMDLLRDRLVEKIKKDINEALSK